MIPKYSSLDKGFVSFLSLNVSLNELAKKMLATGMWPVSCQPIDMTQAVHVTGQYWASIVSEECCISHLCLKSLNYI